MAVGRDVGGRPGEQNARDQAAQEARWRCSRRARFGSGRRDLVRVCAAAAVRGGPAEGRTTKPIVRQRERSEPVCAGMDRARARARARAKWIAQLAGQLERRNGA